MSRTEKTLRGLIFSIIIGCGALLLLQSCGAAYNTEYHIKAKQIIRAPEWDTSTQTHYIAAENGEVYNIFHVPKNKIDSNYTFVKRLSYNRERTLQKYYVNR